MLNARPAGLTSTALSRPERALPVSGPLTVIGAEAMPAALVTTASTYLPGARVIVVPGWARSSAFWIVLNGAAALVPLLVSAPVGATKYAVPAASAGIHTSAAATVPATVSATPTTRRDQTRADGQNGMDQLRGGARGSEGRRSAASGSPVDHLPL